MLCNLSRRSGSEHVGWLWHRDCKESTGAFVRTDDSPGKDPMASLWYEALAAYDPSLPVDRVDKFALSGIDEFVHYLQLARNH